MKCLDLLARYISQGIIGHIIHVRGLADGKKVQELWRVERCGEEIEEMVDGVRVRAPAGRWGRGGVIESSKGGYMVRLAVHGSFVVDLDDGVSKTSVSLNDPTKELLLRLSA